MVVVICVKKSNASMLAVSRGLLGATIRAATTPATMTNSFFARRFQCSVKIALKFEKGQI
jgi:hypothetical protein